MRRHELVVIVRPCQGKGDPANKQRVFGRVHLDRGVVGDDEMSTFVSDNASTV